MSGPVVSIVTPSFNQATYLEETIRSVLDQDYPSIEYAIVDGGSTDGSVDIIRAYADRLAWWVSEPDRGQTHAIRKGWDRASGSILAYLNSDDLYLPGTVRRLVDALVGNPSAALAFGNCDLLDQRTGALRPMDAGPVDLAGVLARRALVPQPATFVRADAVHAAGGLDERLHYAMDFDLWVRILRHGTAHFVEGAPLARYRWHAEAKSNRAAEAFATELVGILDRFYSSPGLPDSARRVRRRAYAEACLVGARAALGAPGDTPRGLLWLLRAARADPSSWPRSLGRVLARRFS